MTRLQEAEARREGVCEQLSCYILPGWLVDPRSAPEDAALAEQIGLGTAWLSEKWDQKDPSVLLGAMTQTTSRIRLGLGVTHPHTRHPLVLASFGSTLQAISGGRGVIAFGRGNPARPWPDMGLPVPTTQGLQDIAHLLRRLWAGETVSYEGPLGRFPALRLNNRYKGEPPDLVVAGYGPKTLAMGGQSYDGVLTIPFLTTESVASMVSVVRSAATDAGRAADDVRLVHPLVVAPGLDPQRQAAVLGGRFVRYLQHVGTPGSAVAGLNGWDPSVVEAVRAHPFLRASRSRGVRAEMRDDDLAQVAAETIPAHWLRDGAAVGTPLDCARRVQEYLDAGADEVLLHGCTPRELVQLVQAFGALAQP